MSVSAPEWGGGNFEVGRYVYLGLIEIDTHTHGLNYQLQLSPWQWEFGTKSKQFFKPSVTEIGMDACILHGEEFKAVIKDFRLETVVVWDTSTYGVKLFYPQLCLFMYNHNQVSNHGWPWLMRSAVLHDLMQCVSTSSALPLQNVLSMHGSAIAMTIAFLNIFINVYLL